MFDDVTAAKSTITKTTKRLIDDIEDRDSLMAEIAEHKALIAEGEDAKYHKHRIEVREKQVAEIESKISLLNSRLYAAEDFLSERGIDYDANLDLGDLMIRFKQAKGVALISEEVYHEKMREYEKAKYDWELKISALILLRQKLKKLGEENPDDR